MIYMCFPSAICLKLNEHFLCTDSYRAGGGGKYIFRARWRDALEQYSFIKEKRETMQRL